MRNRRLALLADAGSVHIVRWAGGLAERGWDVHLLTLHEASPDLPGEVTVHRLGGRAPGAYTLAAPALRARLDALAPGIVHAHYASGYGTLGRLSRRHPFVLSVWGSDVFTFARRTFLHRHLVGSNLAAADVVCATSLALAARSREICPRLRDVPVVPFGVDTDVFVPARRTGRGGVVTIGTVKGLHLKYGIDRLLRAVAAASRTLAADGIVLRTSVVGEGPERHRLAALAAELGVTDLEMPGAVPIADVPARLAALDVFVALSRVEGFGVAVLEAAACGLPAVVSDAGGLPEIVVERVTGHVIPDGDPDLAASALVRLARDPVRRDAMGRAARERAVRRFSWDASLDAMERVYESLREPRA